MSTIRAVALAANRYAEALEQLREANNAEDAAQKAAASLRYHKKDAEGYRRTLERTIAEARKANEIP